MFRVTSFNAPSFNPPPIKENNNNNDSRKYKKLAYALKKYFHAHMSSMCVAVQEDC